MSYDDTPSRPHSAPDIVLQVTKERESVQVRVHLGEGSESMLAPLLMVLAQLDILGKHYGCTLGESLRYLEQAYNENTKDDLLDYVGSFRTDNGDPVDFTLD